MKRYLTAFVFSLLLTICLSLVNFDASAQGCVMCRSQVGVSKDKSEAKKVGASLNTGILYLMAFPYVLIGTVGFIWYRQNKKKIA